MDSFPEERSFDFTRWNDFHRWFEFSWRTLAVEKTGRTSKKNEVEENMFQFTEHYRNHFRIAENWTCSVSPWFLRLIESCSIGSIVNNLFYHLIIEYSCRKNAKWKKLNTTEIQVLADSEKNSSYLQAVRDSTHNDNRKKSIIGSKR